jgi:TATA-box binding protein (TBP) (component of TFIID and TFIIIB)
VVRLDLGEPLDLASILAHPPASATARDLDGIVRLDLDTTSILLFGDGRVIVKGASGIGQAREVVASLLDL